MKTKLIIFPALVGMLCLACGGSEKDSYTEAMQNEVATKGASDEDDVTRQNREEPKPLGQHQLADTLELPEPLLIILQKDPATSLDKIKNVRRYNEDGTDYYEITFDNPVKEKQVITYDNLGKTKSPDLDRPEN